MMLPKIITVMSEVRETAATTIVDGGLLIVESG